MYQVLSISKTDTLVTILRDGRNETVGIGVKYSSRSERTRLLNGQFVTERSHDRRIVL